MNLDHVGTAVACRRPCSAILAPSPCTINPVIPGTRPRPRSGESWRRRRWVPLTLPCGPRLEASPPRSYRRRARRRRRRPSAALAGVISTASAMTVARFGFAAAAATL